MLLIIKTKCNTTPTSGNIFHESKMINYMALKQVVMVTLIVLHVYTIGPYCVTCIYNWSILCYMYIILVNIVLHV